MKPDKPLIVYVDDDEEDRWLLSDALSMAAPEYAITTIADGYAAFEFLQASKNNLPCLVIIDLNMPGMNGKELIAIIRKDQHLNALPIVAFTTSSSQLDKEECAKYGVDMVTKPLTFTELKHVVQRLTNYCNSKV